MADLQNLQIYASHKEFSVKNYLYHRAADYQYDKTMLTLRRKPEVSAAEPAFRLRAGAGVPRREVWNDDAELRPNED